jgi:uncharacterized protein (DUF2237 family)
MAEMNVLGTPLKMCCISPLTGFYRTGYCQVGPDDLGVHGVCIEATDDFLAFSKEAGNDLSTPNPEYGFPGLKPGDRWCLCAPRWQEALEAGMAPAVILEATHEKALEFSSVEDLKRHALDVDFNDLLGDLSKKTL